MQMKKISEKLEINIHGVVVGLLIFTSIILAINVTVQKQHISSLEDEFLEQKEMQVFINQGKRFTYTDGRVVFLMCNDGVLDNAVVSRVNSMYNEHGDTDFSEWLKAGNYID